jgi:hypothetical protein
MACGSSLLPLEHMVELKSKACNSELKDHCMDDDLSTDELSAIGILLCALCVPEKVH